MSVINIKLMTPLQELISSKCQPLLDIAEGKANIETWNQRMIELLESVDKYEKRKNLINTNKE